MPKTVSLVGAGIRPQLGESLALPDEGGLWELLERKPMALARLIGDRPLATRLPAPVRDIENRLEVAVRIAIGGGKDPDQRQNLDLEAGLLADLAPDRLWAALPGFDEAPGQVPGPLERLLVAFQRQVGAPAVDPGLHRRGRIPVVDEAADRARRPVGVGPRGRPHLQRRGTPWAEGELTAHRPHASRAVRADGR